MWVSGSGFRVADVSVECMVKYFACRGPTSKFMEDVTKFAPQKALKSIESEQVDF